jgi:serine/threonine-protein kinase
MGDAAKAAALHERELAIKEKTLGPDHPDTANALASLGRSLVRLGHLDAAEPFLVRSRAAAEKAGGAKGTVSSALLGLGELALARRAPERAAPLLEQALAADSAENGGEIQLALAEALWQMDKDRARARALAERARAAYEHAGNSLGQERAARWLREHPG